MNRANQSSAANRPELGYMGGVTATPPLDSAWRRLVPVAVALAYVAVLLGLYPSVWAPWQTRRMFGWDALDSCWPDLVFLIQSWRDGELPLWNPYDRGGYPFWADPHPAPWSPLTWLLAGLGLLSRSSGPWLMQLKVMLHLWLAGVTMHLYLRSGRKLSHAAAMLGGLSFVISGPLVFHKNGALLGPWALCPVGLLAVEYFVRRRSHAAGALLGAGLALPVVSGFPPSAFYFLLLVGPYLGARVIGAAQRRLLIAPLCTALGVLCALAAPVVVPAALHLPLLARGERTVAYATGAALPWREIAGFVLPSASSHGIYVGVLPLLGAVVALRRRDTALLALLGSGVLGLVLALGAQTPVLPFLAEHLAPFRLFRIAYRYRVIPCLVAIVLGAHGIDALLARLRGRVRLALGVALPLLAALDLRIAHADRLALLERPQAHPNDRERAILATDAGRDTRIFDEWQLSDRAGSRLGVRDFRGRSQDPMALGRYQDVMRRLDRQPGLLAVFGVRDYLYGSHYRSGRAPAWIRDPRRHAEMRPSPGRVFQFDAWPQVFWTQRVRVERDGHRVLDRLGRGSAEPQAVIESGDLPVALRARLARVGGEGFVPGRVTRFARNRVIAEIDAPAEGFVVLNEVWTPDWTLRVDGKTAPLVRANYLMRGAAVGAGRHTLEFRFRPRALYALAPLFFIACLLVAAAALREDNVTG